MNASTLPRPQKQHAWVPDFFIVGAMKCGTTTLHRILAQHPGIFIPSGELFFFDIDDFQQHPDFFAHDGVEWRDFDFVGRFAEYSDWYRAFFRDAKPGQLMGEDSTTYLASPRAAPRIATLNPAAKILVMLRDPASRTYSNYWHLLRSGRALHTFEDTLRLHPDTLLSRSLYKPQLEHLLRHFPRAQIHIGLLEELAADPRRAVAEACRFLGLTPDIPDGAFGLHTNRGDAPRNVRLQIWRNRLMWRRSTRAFFKRLPGPEKGREPLHWSAILLDRLHRKLNPIRGEPPPMQAGTRRFLNAMFRRENKDLDAIVGKTLDRWWYRD